MLGLKYRSVVVLVTLAPDMAHAAGLRVGPWNGLLSVWLGVVIGFAQSRFGRRVRLRQPRLIAKNLGRHEGHTDYLVAGHLHHAHDGHCDDHGVLSTA